jgi:hypothetical protein
MLLLQPSNIIYRTQEKESLLLLLIFAILLIYLPSKHCKISFTISFPFQELSFAHSFRAGLLVTDCPLFLKAIFTGCRIKVDISSFLVLEHLWHFLLTTVVSDEKCAIIQIGFLLSMRHSMAVTFVLLLQNTEVLNLKRGKVWIIVLKASVHDWLAHCFWAWGKAVSMVGVGGRGSCSP